MEAFSLLKYWRGGGGGGGANMVRTPAPTTIAASVPQTAVEMEDENNDEGDDEGPFFDLEFTMPDENDDDGDDDEEEDGSVETDEEREEFDFTVSSGASDGRTDPNLVLSPSDDLFFKGKLVPLEPSSLVFNPSEPNSKAQFPVSLLKSATKFRVFLLGFKKPKPSSEPNAGAAPAQKNQQPPQSKFFTVKFKVEEVPIVSLFTRDSSSRSSNGKTKKTQQQQADDAASADDGGLSSSDAKMFAKVVMQKYLKMIKPLYVKVSRRYGEKLRFSGQLSLGLGKTTTVTMHEAATAAPVEEPEVEAKNKLAAAATATAPPHPANLKNQKQGNLPAGLRVVCKHLGKSRSASSAVAAVPPLQPRRRDDSLLQLQDGIQSAIAHCKRSFNAQNDSEISLPRSASDPSSNVCPRNSTKGKEACI